MINIPVMPEGINKEDYWFLQVEGVEWIYILNEKITKGLEKEKPEEMVMFGLVMDDAQVYAVKKKFVPIETLVKYTGIKKEIIETSEVLKLTVKARPELPRPTVNYWGEA